MVDAPYHVLVDREAVQSHKCSLELLYADAHCVHRRVLPEQLCERGVASLPQSLVELLDFSLVGLKRTCVELRIRRIFVSHVAVLDNLCKVCLSVHVVHIVVYLRQNISDFDIASVPAVQIHHDMVGLLLRKESNLLQELSELVSSEVVCLHLVNAPHCHFNVCVLVRLYALCYLSVEIMHLALVERHGVAGSEVRTGHIYRVVCVQSVQLVGTLNRVLPHQGTLVPVTPLELLVVPVQFGKIDSSLARLVRHVESLLFLFCQVDHHRVSYLVVKGVLVYLHHITEQSRDIGEPSEVHGILESYENEVNSFHESIFIVKPSHELSVGHLSRSSLELSSLLQDGLVVDLSVPVDHPDRLHEVLLGDIVGLEVLVNSFEVLLKHLHSHSSLVHHVHQLSVEVHCRLDVPLVVVAHEILLRVQELLVTRVYSNQFCNSDQVNLPSLVRLKKTYELLFNVHQIRNVHTSDFHEEVVLAYHDFTSKLVSVQRHIEQLLNSLSVYLHLSS